VVGIEGEPGRCAGVRSGGRAGGAESRPASSGGGSRGPEDCRGLADLAGAYRGCGGCAALGELTEPPTEVLFREIKAAVSGGRNDPHRSGGRSRAASRSLACGRRRDRRDRELSAAGFDFPVKPQRDLIEALIAAGIPAGCGWTQRSIRAAGSWPNVGTYIAAARLCSRMRGRPRRKYCSASGSPVGRMPVSV